MARPRSFDDDEVVDRAMDAFWTNGYARTSPAQLAEATGVGKGSLYNAFGSKRQLFDRAFARYDTAGAAFAAEFLARPGSTKQRVGAFLRFLVDTDLDGPVRRGCLVVNTVVEFAGQDDAAVGAAHTAARHTIDVLAARLDQGRRDGDVRADLDPQAGAEFLMNTIAGLRIMTKTHDAPVLHRIIDTALTTL